MAETPQDPLIDHNNPRKILSVDSILQPERQAYTKNFIMNPKQCKIKKLLIILCVISVIGIMAWIYVYHTVPEFNQYRLVKSYEQKSQNEDPANKTRFILLWTTFFDSQRWYLPAEFVDPSQLRNDMKCPVSDCVITHQRDVLPQLDMYDAVVFHTARPFPSLDPIPESRSWKQLYVFAIKEPPPETRHDFTDENKFYNLTMTYRMDSDIIWAYSSIIDKETDLRVFPEEYPKWRPVPNNYNDTLLWELWPYKTKMAAWFVSHCETFSRREKLVEALQKHMEVDVYGKCGPKSCKQNSAECDRLLDKTYKFYLSFENSLCTDYITEKLYKIMDRNIIPVVYGGANYERYLPPHSYINAEEYDTPEDLVNYLKYLSESPEAYMRYFWWRQYYKIETYSAFCDLCKWLHQPNYLLKTQSYQNIEKWWLDGMCRSQSRIKF